MRHIVFFSLLIFLLLGAAQFKIDNQNYKKKGQNYKKKGQTKNIIFQSLDKGWISGYSTSQEKLVIVHNKREWEKLWNLHYSSRSPRGKLPAVDFTQDMVVALFLGFGGGSDQVEITNIKLSEHNNLLIYALKQIPKPKCDTPSVVSSPFHIVKLKKLDITSYSINLDTKMVDCK